MSKEIQILFVEDAPADVVIVSHELRRAGLRFRLKRVESEDAFLHELELNPPDVIFSDHGLPSFDGFKALAIAHNRCPDVPFIFVTGEMAVENVIEGFENGATDCILKKNLSKLAPAVQRALQNAEKKLMHQIGDADRERLIEELHATLLAQRREIILPICSSCKKARIAKNRWQRLEVYLRDYFNARLTYGLCPDCRTHVTAGMKPPPQDPG